jgi:UDP-arabinose 4-epimerase
MRAVLVTGGAGYIGSHTSKLLAEAGCVPVVVDNLSTGHRSAVRFGPLHVGQIQDPHTLREVIRRYGIQDLIHFAAKAYVGESVTNPRKYFMENVANTVHMLDTALETGVKRIIFSSTCATYGTPKKLPIRESAVQRPENPYGESKLFTERMLKWYGDAYGLQWMALRYFNAAGADPDGEIGEDHEPETHLIPCAIQAAVGLKPHLDVYGSDYPTPDGTAIRDYTHVTDLARAHLLALEYLRDGGASTALNLGTGLGHSVLDVVKAVTAACGRKVPVRRRNRRAGDPAELVANPEKARRTLGWKAEYRDLGEIVDSAWQWHKGSKGFARAASAVA